MARTFTWKQRIRYRFDNSLSRGILGVLAWLGLLALIVLVIIAVLARIINVGPDDANLTTFDGFWYGLTRFLDSGTFADDQGGLGRVFGLGVTLIGVFLAAAIIGLVSSSIDSRIDSMRRGRSLVVETGHTLILGDSDKITAVISELIEANASERDAAVVVLAPVDTVEMTELITSAIDDFKTTRLVVRSGNPARLPDLQTTNPGDAKSVIVLHPTDGSDAEVVKTVLGVMSLVGDADVPVVAELQDPDTAAALSEAVGDRLLSVTSTEVVARIGAQVARMPGLGTIYQEFLDFEGDELYSTPVTAQWAGRNFGEAMLASSRGTIIGHRDADGVVTVSPDPSTVLAEGDLLIGIAEDDSVFTLDTAPVDWQRDADRAWIPIAKHRERTLIIGWSDLAPLVASELDAKVAPESEIHLLVDALGEAAEAIVTAMSLRNQQLTIHAGSPISKADVHQVLSTGHFNHVMLLSENGRFDVDEADARTLLTLLHVHSFGSGDEGVENVVAELLDPNSSELTGAAENRDFIVSQRLIALLLAQLSETPKLKPVFDDIFDSSGALVAIHPVERYVPLGSTTMRQLIEAGREWGVVVIGYRAAAAAGKPGALAGGIRVNPPKDEQIVLNSTDAVIVIERDR